MTEQKRIALPGSSRARARGASILGPTDPKQIVEVSVVLKHRRELNNEAHTAKRLTHEEFAAIYGSDPDHVTRIRAFAAAHQLDVIEDADSVARRTMKLRGTVANLEKAFGVTLNDYRQANARHRGRTGAIHLPEDVAGMVQGVFGLDNRPQALPHFRLRRGLSAHAGNGQPAGTFTPGQVATLYNFPTGVNGSGQTIGIIELGGGYNQQDLVNYFSGMNPAPNVTSVSVDGGTNSPSTPDSADGEVLLDIEVAGSVAPGANIVVYFAPNTDQGFLDAMSTAIHDTANNPSVISISWGAPEVDWTAQSMQTMDQVAQEAAALGVTITVASGDNGSTDGVNDGQNHVDFPASSPNVLACGGTSIQVASSIAPGAITSETAWNELAQGGGATGGGYSSVFPQPGYQQQITNATSRGVPDVSGDADPNTGYQVLVDGQWMVVGGTSAVAPLWAGLIALINQQNNARLGFMNPLIYPAQVKNSGFTDVTQGSNGTYNAGPGWDAATGLGSPLGMQLAGALMPQQVSASMA